ncbi:sensor histidine kinase [Azohydromonas caseinilytica]|uniref:histidine kinase n=1 Tax=Azohydromonas caseinilytica TaxID=2728836 RepID=A0A848F7W6_9BURK|nr:ATP-binding protein [Azohydromonas caseinilytica]NML16207.1 HAMP domain-containing protein [Azohydromonas caseinilytica]
MSSKARRTSVLVGLVALTGVALVAGFVLSLSTGGAAGDPDAFYERHWTWLFIANLAVLALLTAVLLTAAGRLALRVRRGKFGSRLLLKLAGIFALVGVVPGALVYTVSYQFVTRSIEIWFDARVEGALNAGLALGRSTLDAQQADLAAKTQFAAEHLADTPGLPMALALERAREQLSAQTVALVSPSGQVLFSVGGSATAIAPARPSAALLRQARGGRVASQIEGLDDEGTAGAPPALVRAIAAVPRIDITLAADDRFLMAVRPLPGNLTSQALAVQAAYREYQQRALAREGLRRMYIGTLTLTLILAVFGAVLLAVALGHQLARPLLLLAEGVRQVAAGDLGAKPVFASRDELGGLTRSFADMTQQLAEARAQAHASVTQLQRARAHLQTILDNMTAGVIVFDEQRRIDTVNPGATRILKSPLSACRGQRLEEVPGLQEFAQAIWQRFELLAESPEAGERGQWQDAFERRGDPAADRPEQPDVQTLLVRGATLPQEARLVVFDDISEVVSAQRSAAWAEVARRLAHEIKNPLTPIQLSAERLQHRLEAKLEGNDQALLVRSVGTIVTQVQAMKELVNEFRDYARLPSAQLAALDLNALIAEVLALYGHAIEQGRLVVNCAPDLPWVQGDATQLRQVVHNLLQNALDAVADKPDGRVQLFTEVQSGEQGTARGVRLRILDNGPGFADKVLKRAFEPYVTTKTKGTGLGLAVVKKIADEHGARVRIANRSGGEAPDAPAAGAQVTLSFSNLAAAPAVPAAAASAFLPPAS